MGAAVGRGQEGVGRGMKMTRTMQTTLRVSLGSCLVLSGCASLFGAPVVRTPCTFDEAWSVALASLNEFEIRRVDRRRGTIETDWVVVRAMTKAGLLQRDVNRERVRFLLQVTQENEGASVAVHQLREQWSPMGAQYREWRRAPPITEEEKLLAQRIRQRLKSRKC